MTIVTRAPARSGRPRVLAHRGSSLAFPEHTRAAYRRALDDGADGLECDLRLTADLVPVLLHDSRLDATTSATGAVGAWPAAELEQVQVYARHGRRSRRTVAPGDAGPPFVETGVLPLSGLLALVAAAGRPVELALETKHPSRAGRQLEAAVLAVLAVEPAVAAHARIMSFSAAALRRVRVLAPAMTTVLLLTDAAVGRFPGLPPEADIAGPSVRHLRRDPGLVNRLHDAGAQVHVWTVDADADIDHCAGLGVEVLISNRPGYVLDRLGR